MADFVPVPVVEGEPVGEWAEAHQQAVQDAFSSVARRAQSATAATYNGDGTVATYTVDGVTTTYTYNGDGTVATASTPQGSQTRVETFSYTAGVYTGSTVVIS